MYRPDPPLRTGLYSFIGDRYAADPEPAVILVQVRAYGGARQPYAAVGDCLVRETAGGLGGCGLGMELAAGQPSSPGSHPG